MLRDRYGDEYVEELLKELNVEITDDYVKIPRDFCFCSLLGFWPKNYTNEQYDNMSDFALWLELFLGTCDGNKDKEFINTIIKDNFTPDLY